MVFKKDIQKQISYNVRNQQKFMNDKKCFVCVCNESRFINKIFYMHINAYFTEKRVNPYSHNTLSQTLHHSRVISL